MRGECPVTEAGTPGFGAPLASPFGLLLTLTSCVLRFILVALFGLREEAAFRDTFGMGYELIYGSTRVMPKSSETAKK